MFGSSRLKVENYLSPASQKKLWKKLRTDSPVPVVTKEQYSQMNEILEGLSRQVLQKDYYPKKLIGFLGACKKLGATRFIPVMEIEDFSVFYACVSLIEENISFDDIDGVYGGWRMRENSNKSRKSSTEESWGFGGYVFDSALSEKEWIESWKNYSELLNEECNQAQENTFFHSSDIANFYDSIDLSKLESKIKRTLNEWDDSIDLLFHFLMYWNRTVKGYQPSSKGLPQEIVQDASRLLANFYLRDSDYKIKEICDAKNVKYIRWSDDVVFIGQDKNILEEIVYLYSKELLKIDLNLNSSKTVCYSRDDFKKYKALDVLEKLNSRNVLEIDAGIELFKLKNENKEVFKRDTVLKNLITILDHEPKGRDGFGNAWRNWERKEEHKNFVKDYIISKDYEILSILDSGKFIRFINFYPSIEEAIIEILSIISSRPYTLPKAEFLRSLGKIGRKNISDLGILGFINSCILILLQTDDESKILKRCYEQNDDLQLISETVSAKKLSVSKRASKKKTA